MGLNSVIVFAKISPRFPKYFAILELKNFPTLMMVKAILILKKSLEHAFAPHFASNSCSC